MSFTLTTRAVNSKRLLTTVQELEVIFTDFGVMWSSDNGREAAIEIIEEMMASLYLEGKITQWNVMCDYRNNSVADMNAGIYNLHITYKQTHCLNTTSLEYQIKEDTLELDLDFEF